MKNTRSFSNKKTTQINSLNKKPWPDFRSPNFLHSSKLLAQEVEKSGIGFSD
jgi:hypothetical protein